MSKKTGMPALLVLIRHGESQANVVQKLRKNGQLPEYPAGFTSTPDREFRLSEEGRDQARLTGEWIKEFGLPMGGVFPDIDRIYVSDHVRAKETAGLMCQAAEWENDIYIDPLLGERTWGEFSELDEVAQSVLLDRRKRDPFHTYLNGGESMLQARLRSRALLERLSREHPGEVVVVFTHGEFIESLWSEIEHMSTEAHAPFFHSPEGNIRNCQLVLFRSVSARPDLPFKIKTVESFCPTRNEFHRERELRRKPLSAAALLTEAESYAVLAIPSLQGKAECSGPGGR